MDIVKMNPGEVFAFNLLGLRLAFVRSAIYGSIIITIIAAVCAYFFAQLTPLDALIAGILAVLLHWFGDILHHYGHFIASKTVGHPMIGVRFWGIAGTSLYHANEGELPARVHIRRALGGPIMSFVVMLIGMALWFFFGGFSPMLNFLLAWFVWEHVLLWFGGSLAPISANGLAADGGTILYWMRKK